LNPQLRQLNNFKRRKTTAVRYQKKMKDLGNKRGPLPFRKGEIENRAQANKGEGNNESGVEKKEYRFERMKTGNFSA